MEILTQKEKQKCYEAFVAFDKNGSGFIEKDELRKVLEGNLVIYVLRDGTKTNRGRTNKDDKWRRFFGTGCHREGGLFEGDSLSQNDLINEWWRGHSYFGNFYVELAFIALGGNDDKSGSVDKQKLLHVIQTEFNLTIDLNVYQLFNEFSV